MTTSEFWRWFVAIEPELRWPAEAKIVEAIGERLHDIDPGLGFELTRREGFVELAISASGNASLFPLAIAVAAAAPPMTRFRVVALRQRGPIGSLVMTHTDGGSLSMQDIWFAIGRTMQGLGLYVFVRDFVDGDGELQERVYLLLDNALGEYDVVQNIAWITWAPLPPDPRGARLSPLSDLPAAFDRALGRH